MNVSRVLALPLGLAVAAALVGCLSTPPQPTEPARTPVVPPQVTAAPPPLVDSVPDAVPRVEPRSRSGNPPFYDVFGKRYYVLSSSVGYIERGVASWYGPGFHKVRTSTGEPYDMYGMTAAHKTLPLPAYVRVTNLQNGRSVVLRVNDRGPFVGNRIIDLSYTAAAKLDILRKGTAFVEVRTIDPSTPLPVMAASTTANTTASVSANASGTGLNAGSRPAAPVATAPAAVALAAVAPTAVNPTAVTPGAAAPGAAAPGAATPTSTALPASAQTGAATGGSAPAGSGAAAAASSALFIQAGAFSDPANAERLAEKLRGGGYGKIFVRDDKIAGRRMYRVRIGPVRDVAEFDRVVAGLDHAGVHDAHLALD